jgi:hypothetical protein
VRIGSVVVVRVFHILVLHVFRIIYAVVVGIVGWFFVVGGLFSIFDIVAAAESVRVVFHVSVGIIFVIVFVSGHEDM